MSCVEILVALYEGGLMMHDPRRPDWQERDRLFVSKGQASPAVYAVLAHCGYFDRTALDNFAQKGGLFSVHLQKSVPGVEITCGSLGHGFGIAVGVALGARMNRELFLTYTLLGDGECYEGSIWEAAMFAAHHRLNNLVAIVDRNGLCVTDFTENLVALEPLEKKWAAFGWEVARIDGHSFEQILSVLKYVRSRRIGRPLVVIADTVKGYGLSNLSNIPLWHGVAPSGDVAGQAFEDLGMFCQRCKKCIRPDISRSGTRSAAFPECQPPTRSRGTKGRKNVR
mgnify:CR=1 FL=1